MKNICLTTTVAALLLIFSNGVQAQTNLDQLKAFEQYLGVWQVNVAEDTIEIWEFKQYGKDFVINVNQVIKGQKTPLFISNIGFDSKEGKFKGFMLYHNGDYSTWIGLFTSEKKFSGDVVQDFNPEITWAKFENVFVNPKEWTMTQFNTDGVKTSELKFIKVE